MIIHEMFLEKEPEYPFELLAPRERILFFDIETTGLSAKNASLYLIGAVYYEEGRWKLKQFFAESMYDEPKLLESFFRLLSEKKKAGRIFLVSYNGEGFDIPFLNNCVRQYGLPYDMKDAFSIDLFKKIKPFRKLLGLCDCKLKTVEKLCGIFREDKYSGGELIYVYEEYLRLSALDPESCENNENNRLLKEELLRVLLLHNAEDIMDMPQLMGILGYDGLLSGAFRITESLVADRVWDIHAELENPLPKSIYLETPEYVLSVSEENEKELNLAVSLYEGELKSFYADYKNYYYLPAEDYAIHKSVGEFVDRKARRQATAKTCYQRVPGTFVPEPEAIFAPMFYKDYKVLPAYGRLPGPEESAASAEADSAARKDSTYADAAARKENAGAAAYRIDPETTRRYLSAVLKSLLQESRTGKK